MNVDRASIRESPLIREYWILPPLELTKVTAEVSTVLPSTGSSNVRFNTPLSRSRSNESSRGDVLSSTKLAGYSEAKAGAVALVLTTIGVIGLPSMSSRRLAENCTQQLVAPVHTSGSCLMALRSLMLILNIKLTPFSMPTTPLVRLMVASSALEVYQSEKFKLVRLTLDARTGSLNLMVTIPESKSKTST